MIDELGRVTKYAFDADDRLVGITDAANGIVTFEYDAVDNRTAFTDENNHTTRYTYDARDQLVTQTDAAGFSTHLAYDAGGNLLTSTDALGQTTNFSYDKLNRLATRTEADLGVTLYSYDARSNRTVMTDPLGRTTNYAYDELNRILTVTDPRASVVVYGYDKVGNRTSLTDPNGNITTFSFDADDRLVAETDPYLKSRTYEYDAVDNLIASTDRNVRRREFTYDALDRRTTELWKATDGSDAYTATYTYDAASNLLNAGDAQSAYAYDYDALNRVVEVNNAGTANVPNMIFTYGYDKAGNRTSVADNFGVRADSSYDERDLLTSRSWQGDGIAEARFNQVYDAVGQRVSLDCFADLAGTQLVASTIESHDPVGRLTQRTTSKANGTPIVDYRYSYDLAGQVLSESHHGESVKYTHDLASQVLTADHTGQNHESYGYDAAGNHTADGQTVSVGNRITADAEFDYAYDDEGNLVTKSQRSNGEVTEFTYDHP